MSPIAPGTVGSLRPSLIAIAHRALTPISRHLASPCSRCCCLVPAIWAAGRCGARGRSSKIRRFVVVDEVIGQWITLAGARTLNWKSYLAAFVLFRLFDIWKPPPVRQLERLPGGLGHRCRRRDGRRLRRACLIRSRMVQSLLDHAAS